MGGDFFAGPLFSVPDMSFLIIKMMAMMMMIIMGMEGWWEGVMNYPICQQWQTLDVPGAPTFLFHLHSSDKYNDHE